MEEKTLIGNMDTKVLLSELKDADKQSMFEWINNKELVEFNSYFNPVSWENHCKWFDSIRNRADVRIFAIRGRVDDILIGSCQLLHINELTKSAELQIRLGFFSEMGKGLGSQAIDLLLKYGFENLDLQRIYLHVFADNERAYRSYIKNNFTDEGILRRAAFINNKFVDVRVMSILKEEYKK